MKNSARTKGSGDGSADLSFTPTTVVFPTFVSRVDIYCYGRTIKLVIYSKVVNSGDAMFSKTLVVVAFIYPMFLSSLFPFTTLGTILPSNHKYIFANIIFFLC